MFDFNLIFYKNDKEGLILNFLNFYFNNSMKCLFGIQTYNEDNYKNITIELFFNKFNYEKTNVSRETFLGYKKFDINGFEIGRI